MKRRDETEDQWRARMEEKAEAQRYFSRMERGVVEALHAPPSAATVTAQVSTAAKAARPREKNAVRTFTAGMTPVPFRPKALAAPDEHFCANPECAKKMRSSRYSATDKPGTVQYGAHGLCHRCAYHPDRPRAKTRPTHCATCNKVMRKSDQTIADVPGSVQHGRGATCQPCLRKKARQARRATTESS